MDELNRNDLGSVRGLSVVEVYKDGCTPCEQLSPVLEGLSKAYQGRISFYKSHFVNGGLGQHFRLNIEHTPTILLLKDGEVVGHFTGARYSQGVGSDRTSADAGFLKKKIDAFVVANHARTTSRIKDLETELELSENSLITLRERYLKKDDSGEVIERPEDMFRRVAENVAQADRNYGATNKQVQQTAELFYKAMSSFDFLPNSPTLMNAGRDLQQLSGCFVLPIEDSIESIFGAAMNGALVHKSGGGTGYSFSHLRPKNSAVRSTNGVASGPASFIYVFNQYTEVVKQGGTRRGANMAVLRIDHPDIRDFIHAKGQLNETNKKIRDNVMKKTGLKETDPYIVQLTRELLENTQLNNFNTSVGATKGFMEAVKQNGNIDLKNPLSGKIVETVNARKLLEEIVDQAWKSGDPGIIFLDRINEYNPTPHIGEIEATNPCGEQPLLPNESCNLGSINLSKFIRNKEIDFERLEQTVNEAVHFLDNVIDMNQYPLQEIEEMTKANRKIGLGVMGFAEMLTMLHIPYGSEESFGVAENVMKFIRDKARTASVKLAEKRGVFPNWKGSIYDPESEYFQGEELKLRTATVTTIAPTGSLAQIADCSWGIEPEFFLACTKTVLDGKVLHFRARGLERVLQQEIGNDKTEEIFRELEIGKQDKFEQLPERLKRLGVTTMDLTTEQHLKIQAAFQNGTDNAVSKTVNLSGDVTREDIMNIYLMAYNLGCKGVTIYRQGSKDAEVFKEIEKEDETKDFAFGTKLPKRVLSITREEQVGDGKRVFITTGYWENPRNEQEIERLERDGRATQVFLDANFFNPATQPLITALAIRCSKDLRQGIPPEQIANDLRDLPPADEQGYDNGFGERMEYVNRSVPDAMWKALVGWKPPINSSGKKNEKEGIEEKKILHDNNKGFSFCTQCSRYGVTSREGCDKCIFCGYSKKGCG